MRGPLAGPRVADLPQVLSGPFCTMLLAGPGADVVKAEPPGSPVKFASRPAVPFTPAPRLGEHPREVLDAVAGQAGTPDPPGPGAG